MSDTKAQPEPSMEEILATISRIIAEDKPAGAAVAAGEQEEVLDLTEALGDDGTVLHMPPFKPAPPEGTAAAGDAGDPDRTQSAPASGAAAAAFAQLAAVAQDRRRDSEVQIGGGGGRTLEDLVREMLRPMVQAWLDQNLGAIVERLVREEIARVVGEAGLR